jgi:signal transduction histidine kinase
LGHDLRNPLSAISMAAGILERHFESVKIAKPVSRIRTSAERMERMIAQLLDFTRARLGQGIPLEPTPVELAELCRTVIGELETGTGCKVELEQRGDTHGHWDHDRLAQLVSNLAANACHHGTRGHPVTVRLDGTAGERVKLEVHNHGTISPELMPVLFEPLRSSDARKKRHQSSGLGLGLYISQQIVLAHGGELRVESDDAQGTRFLIELPRTPPAATRRVFASSSA